MTCRQCGTRNLWPHESRCPVCGGDPRRGINPETSNDLRDLPRGMRHPMLERQNGRLS